MKSIRMTRKQADLWLSALRSGEYEKGRGSLVSADGTRYCCLGVLEKVLEGEVEPSAQPSIGWLKNHGIEFKAPRYKNADGAEIQEWISHTDPTINTAGVVSEMLRPLTQINDHTSATFPQIADLIEANLEIIPEKEEA